MLLMKIGSFPIVVKMINQLLPRDCIRENFQCLKYYTNSQMEPFFVVDFFNLFSLDSSFKNVSASSLGFPESSENSFAVSVGYIANSSFQSLLYSLLVALGFSFKIAIS